MMHNKNLSIFLLLLINVCSIQALGEKVPFALLRKILPEKPIILEAGAQWGEDTNWMSEFWAGGTIHAFEPSPESYKSLLDIAAKHSNIRTYPLALSTNNELAPFYLCGGASSLLKPTEYYNTVYFHSDLEHPIAVQCVTLDAWAQDNGISQIDFMWLDMEGNELKALQAGEHILQTVKAIYTEVNLQMFWQDAVQYQDLKNWLETKGFIEIWKDITPDWHGNVLFVRD